MKPIVICAFAAVLWAVPAFGQPIFHATPDWISADTPYSTGAALVDLNRDGWLDLVVANGNDIGREKLVVYYNNHSGAFPFFPSWQSSDTEYNGHLSVADVNGDGWPDVAVGLTYYGYGTSTARVYLNNAGTLSLLPDWESDITVAGFQVAFGDVNGDGRPDLAVGTGWPYSGANQWHNYIYLNVNGVLEPTPSWVSDDTLDLGDVFFCDVNRDGWLDLVGVGEGTDTWVYLNNQGTLATTATWHTTDNPNQFGVMGTYGDVNGDGWFELIATDNYQLSGGSGYFRRYDGLPGGLFTTTPTWTYYEGYCSAVALADIDADGDLDLVTGGWWDNTRYFLNAAGLFPASPTWSSGGTSVVEKIVFGDVDKDGLRYPVETFDATGTPGRHLFQLARQPIERIESVTVDYAVLGPDGFTCDPVHGWVSIGQAPSTSVAIRYVYSLKPDMAVTNWDDELGNYLYYNQNSAPALGDLDGDGGVDFDDFQAFAGCMTGPDGGLLPACAPADADLDNDVDLADFAIFATGS